MEANSDSKDLLSQLPIMLRTGDDCVSEVKFAVAVGWEAGDVLLITKNDHVFAVGKNKGGCLGVGDTSLRTEPTLVRSLCGKNVSIIASGYEHVMAVTADGALFVWGENQFHQLGDGSSEPLRFPLLCRGLDGHKVRRVACGAGHSMALTDAGEVYAWGYNSHGEVGTDTAGHRPTPLLVDGLPAGTVSDIRCCFYSSFALTSDGAIFGWGCNENGQLGVDSTTNHSSPQRVGETLDVTFKSFECGTHHTLALTGTGEVFAWGHNTYGQVGVGSTTDTTAPAHVDLANLSVVEVGASIRADLSAAMTSCGTVFVWGHCRDVAELLPKEASCKSLHDVFLCLSHPAVTYKPLRPLGEEVQENGRGEDEGASIRNCLRLHFDNEEVSDVAFVVEGRTLHGHASFLRMRSPYLRAMLSPTWTGQRREVEVKEHPYIVFRAFLNFLYTGEVDVDADDGMAVLQLADECCEEEMKGRCERLICSSVNVDNVFLIYAAAKKLSAEYLEDHCFQFAIDNLTAATQTKAYQSLDPLTIQEFFLKAAKHNAFKT